MTDHDVKQYGTHLAGKKIAVVVTGGIASYKAPSVVRALRMYGAEVVPFMTKESQKFVTVQALKWASSNDVVTELTEKSEHLSHNGREYDATLVFPATYNFIGKMANGIADDASSTLIASQIGSKPIMYCPAMHGSMAESPILKKNMTTLTKCSSSARSTISHESDLVYDLSPKVENGKWNVRDTKNTVANFVRFINVHEGGSLTNKKILITAGPTPTKIDNVRLMTNKFSGKLGIEIANELYLQGAEINLFQSYTGIRPPSYIPHSLFKDYDEYKSMVMNICNSYNVAILSAAVADYRPITIYEGKLPSGGAVENIELKQTDKVVDLLIKTRPHLKVVSFKYEETEENPLAHLESIASERLDKGHYMVVGNDIHLNGKEQRCFFFKKGIKIFPGPMEATGKINIARALTNLLAKSL